MCVIIWKECVLQRLTYICIYSPLFRHNILLDTPETARAVAQNLKSRVTTTVKRPRENVVAAVPQVADQQDLITKAEDEADLDHDGDDEGDDEGEDLDDKMFD